jgi:predicted deacylase
MTNVGYESAEQDAQNIVDYLVHRGLVQGEKPRLPDLKHPPTPLAGCEYVYSPLNGVISFHCRVGDSVKVGDPLVDVIDPITDEVVTLRASTEGVVYVREIRRYAVTGMWLCKVAGAHAYRTGYLLSA